MDIDSPRLKRPQHPMPDFVRLALEERDLVGAYKARPAYQQNDYLGWIDGAKRPETREKRLRSTTSKGRQRTPDQARRVRESCRGYAVKYTGGTDLVGPREEA